MEFGQQFSVWNSAFPGEASMERRQCTKWVRNSEDCYWQHSADRQKSFLHFFKGTGAAPLALNKNFFGLFGGAVSDVVRIYLRSGDFYHVTAYRSGSVCILDNGWNLIWKDHGIVDGDYGVFTYRGPSEMRLMVFDRSGLEKHSTFVISRGNQQLLGIVDEHESLGSSKMVIVGRNVTLGADQLSWMHACGHGSMPSYICRMSAGNIDKGYLNFSKEYTTRCGINKSDRSLFLTNPDWSIVMLAHLSIYHGIARITSGWKGFARCNGIKAGCLVLFKMDRSGKRERLRATVHVLKHGFRAEN